MAFYGKYNMLADVYTQTVQVQPSGQKLREWDYDNPTTIECIARGFSASGLRNVGSTERFDEFFDDVEWIRVKTITVLDKRHRIGNIRTVNRWNDVELQWVDSDGSPEIFDVQGVNATQDPWGRLMEYEALAKKVDK